MLDTLVSVTQQFFPLYLGIAVIWVCICLVALGGNCADYTEISCPDKKRAKKEVIRSIARGVLYGLIWPVYVIFMVLYFGIWCFLPYKEK